MKFSDMRFRKMPYVRCGNSGLNDTLKKPTPRSNSLRQGFARQELRGIYGFLPFGTGCRPTRCFLEPCSNSLRQGFGQSRATGNDQVQASASFSTDKLDRIDEILDAGP